ncbi:MAG: hypothetical protein LBS61_05945 [Endomicrobium sp.]|nr:hypothetical protein [Endomicrobium sp.]
MTKKKRDFCAIEKYSPEPVDADETTKVSKAIKELSLSYSVIAPVTRDDLPDGCARHFAKTANEIKSVFPIPK